jgi:hypothetical protein
MVDGYTNDSIGCGSLYYIWATYTTVCPFIHIGMNSRTSSIYEEIAMALAIEYELSYRCVTGGCRYRCGCLVALVLISGLVCVAFISSL